MSVSEFDYIIVGGGLTGRVVASHLKQSSPSSQVLLLEAGVDPVPHTVHSGEALGGGTTINFGGWSRGDAADYDLWAKTVGDKGWAFFDREADDQEHGFEGPVRVTSVSASDPSRRYPLQEPLKDVWAEVGEQFNPASGTGQLSGVVEFLETWQGGERQAAYQAYSLDGVKVITGATAHNVGRNLIDHFALYQLWKLRDLERGLALGSPKLVHPVISTLGLPPAVQKDKMRFGPDMDESILTPAGPVVETITLYVPIGLPADGSLITTGTMLLAATSRGTVSIKSLSPIENLLIDSNYYDTETDKAVLTYGARRTAKVMLDTAAMGTYIECEVPPPGLSSSTSQSSDEEFDARIRATGLAHHHPSGTAAMRKVVDADLRVFGVRSLRVVDASILPVSIGGHPQATLYAAAEQAADIISQADSIKM
ncbi:uncharacterized protein BDV14DRAFT_190468 [Aspergillus stella-maris]|uniref:uncharacterized protein n=1 Tax=Aspergillus stella-maris TaxID=1810926 RepID=UPI003CCD9AF1